MLKRLFTVVLTCLTALSSAQNPTIGPQISEEDLQHKMRAASIAYDALQEDQAEEIYQGLLENKLPLWQDAVIRYNAGVATLPTKDWPSALTQFGSLYDAIKFPDPLQEKVLINLSYSILQQTLEKRKGSKASFPLDEAIYNLREALHLLQKGVGDNCCPPLFQAIEGKLSGFLQTQEANKMTKLSDQQRFMLLGDWLNTAKHQLKNLSKSSLSDIEKNKKSLEIAAFLNLQESLWGLSEASAFDPKLYDKARGNYLSAIQSLQSQEIQEALLKVSKSYSAIRNIERQLKPLDLKGELEEVTRTFADAIALTTLTKTMQHKMYHQVSELAKKFSHESEGDSLSQVRAAILLDKIALDLLDEGKVSASNYYTKAAFQRLMRAQQDLEENNDTPSKYHLKVAINEQKNALELITYLSKMTKNDPPSKAMISFALEVQKAACSVADHFTEVTLDYQMKLFKGEDKAKQCQDKPWNEVFPLFYKGLSTCKSGINKLSNPPLFYLEIIFYQKKNLEYWQKALALLNETTSPPSSSDHSLPPPPPKQNPESENMERMIQMLIEMDMEDEATQDQKRQLKQEDMPW